MAYFGLPGTESSEGGEFLSENPVRCPRRLLENGQTDATGDGSWSDEESEPYGKPSFAIDFGTLEVGFIKFASPPVFVVVPYGSPVPL